jgi:hypothetical protein
MSYSPLPTAANTVTDLRDWANREVQRISNAFFISAQTTIPVLNAEPSKPQTGQLVLADGTNWNPGSGRGLYYYDSGWVFIA